MKNVLLFVDQILQYWIHGFTMNDCVKRRHPPLRQRTLDK